MYTCLPVTLPASDISCVTGRFCCYQDRNCIQVRDSSSVETTPVVVYRVKAQSVSYGNRSDTSLLINRRFIEAENLVLGKVRFFYWGGGGEGGPGYFRILLVKKVVALQLPRMD